MKKTLLFFLILVSCLGIDINIDKLNKTKYYLGQIDRFEKFKVCFYSNEYSGFFVTNISDDVKFLKDRNCIFIYSLKNTTYGKKYIKISFMKCLDPFNSILCDAFNDEKKYIILTFNVNKSYLIKILYNKINYIYKNNSIKLVINKNSLGDSYFTLENVKIYPEKYKSYDIKKNNNKFEIIFYPVIEGTYKIKFDIVRNNFERTHVSLNVKVFPTIEGKIKNIKSGTLLIPSFLQGFYSLISLFIK